MCNYLKISAVLIVAVLVVFTAGMARAQVTLTVDNLNDANPLGACQLAVPDDCTLRDAISLSNATPGTPVNINFDQSICDTFGKKIMLIDQLIITEPVAINGDDNCAFQLTLDASNISGPGRTPRVFYINTSGDPSHVIITRLNLIGGSLSGNNGGAIYIDGSTADILDNTISGNAVTGAGSKGGGIFITDAAGNANVLVGGNAITGNSSDDSGGGIYVEDLANANTAAVLVQNNTITGNTALEGGAIYLNGGTESILNTTISGNTTSTPGGATIMGINTPILTVINSIIANDTAGVSCGFVPAVQTRNIDSGTSCGWSTNTGSFSSTDPLLGTLGDYSGPNPTMPLLPGSPAIDNGATGVGAGTCIPLGTDMRYNPAVGTCDIGAYESQGFALALVSGDNQTAVVGSAFANPLVVSVTPVAPEPVDGGLLTFTGPLSGAGTSFSGSTTVSVGGGNASLAATANTIPGIYQVTADARGNSGAAVAFNLENAASLSVTTIAADTPDPSYPSETVTVDVTVTGLSPSGLVDITGADQNCTITLDNGAGSCDVVFTNPGPRTLTATYGGDGLNLGSADTEAHEVFFPPGDSDHDGNADIFWRDASRAITLVSYFVGTDYSGTFRMLQRAVPAPWEMAAAADFDLDGHTDLLWRNPVSGTNVIAHYQDNMLLNFKVIPGQGPEWRAFGTGDSNKDRYPDIFWYNTQTRANEVWYMQNWTRLDVVDLPWAPAPWEPLGVGDFNNDTNPDAIARSNITGRVIVAFLSATNLQGISKLPVASTGWDLCGTIDLSGDHMPDLVWRDPMSGHDEAWIIENGSRTSTVAMPLVQPGWDCTAGHK